MRRVGQQALGLEDRRGLHRLALGVDRVQLARDLERALGVLREQQLEPGVGTVEATGRVDPRPEGEPERALVDALRVDPRDAHQRAEARAPGARKGAQAAPHERAVLPHQRNEVGDGRKADDVQLVVELRRVAAGRGEQRPGELERDPGRAQVGRVSAHAGVHDGAIRKDVAGTVMVRDDHVHAERLRVRDLLDRADAAVGRYQQARAAGVQVLDRGA